MTDLSITEKPCLTCRQTKNVLEFTAKPRNNSGYSSECRRCAISRCRRYAERMQHRSIDEFPEAPEKRCYGCGLVKARSEFYRDRRTHSGLHGYCKPCISERRRKAYKCRPKRPPELVYVAQRRKQLRKLGLTLESYAEMLAAQNETCAICKRPQRTKRALAVDHDHATGKIRALLCDHCNRGLGYFFDRPDLLEVARCYLITHAA